ncbi:hypothetical protein BDP27DRAFT_1241926 [Rhodocollybia butyracea]|uniref:Uncharacterized protein n=1 Tax=Rhodocollybia butyracea TaxID=206335 RepID=A0A9P5P9F2_9AGAR|nr:hypothetical protein BDP27DRAFT_1241926 [Rhodocollybia butyracea]
MLYLNNLVKVHGLSFAIVHSTTIALPAWHSACREHNCNVQLIPRDVATRWNSTYGMLVVTHQYLEVVDEITANKKLQLRKYELSEQQWKIVDDLIHVLEVV